MLVKDLLQHLASRRYEGGCWRRGRRDARLGAADAGPRGSCSSPPASAEHGTRVCSLSRCDHRDGRAYLRFSQTGADRPPPCAKPEVRRHGRHRCREVRPLPVHHVRHEGVLGSNPRLAPASPFGDDGSTTSRRSGRSGGACGKQDVANRLTAVYRGPPESDYGAEALLAMAAKPLRIIIGISILHHATSRYPHHFR